MGRIKEHPILDIEDEDHVDFTFDGRTFKAERDEVISSALFANDIHIFGEHHRDDGPLGIFCANGQCSQCLVLADGVPVKACITPIEEGVEIESIEGLPELPEDDEPVSPPEVEEVKTEVLIIGGGPAGLCAAIELGDMDVDVIIADDKQELGGKLGLQTHNFFGTIEDCFAGMRGIEIGEHLSSKVRKLSSVDVWLDSPVVGVFYDKKVGVVKEGTYKLVDPDILVNTAGARERPLSFDGGDLPGVYGAGAFQTLANRDRIRPSDKIFVVGGGNVGLIAAYHALQAGIDVVGLAEALPECGGYDVHLDKLRRFGVPIYTAHTVLKAEGQDHVEKIVITEIDENFEPIPGTQKEFDVDTILLAVGLSPIDEISEKANEFDMEVYEAGDAQEIAEASAAIFSGKIVGRKILRSRGSDISIPERWEKMLEMMREGPGKAYSAEVNIPEDEENYPVIRCAEEIPCDPCIDVCPKDSILIPGDIKDLPEFQGTCIQCGRCVAICPGLAITLVDKEHDPKGDLARVVIPWEMPKGTISSGEVVTTSGFKGETIGEGKVIDIKDSPLQNKREMVSLEVPAEEADRVAGIKIYEGKDEEMVDDPADVNDEDIIICRCERITKGEVVKEIRSGVKDINSLKARTRVGMGACGGKTCMPLIKRIFKEEGIDLSEVEDHVERPFTQEVNMKALVKERGDEDG